MPNFTHLHVHSTYSILDGMSSISGLVNKCIASGMNALALTDHGNMFGIKDFFDYVSKINSVINSEIKEIESNIKKLTAENEQNDKIIELQNLIETKKKNIFKPIFGCEVYVTRKTSSNPEGSRFIKEFRENISGDHLILLAKNKVGYYNLCKLVSLAWIEGEYLRPRIDKEILEKYKEGLIVSSACLAGEIHKKIETNNYEAAKEAVLWFKQIFKDDYYLELQRHQTDKNGADTTVYHQQAQQNVFLIQLAKETNTKLIATNDVHFIEEEHGEAHDRLICLSTGKKLKDTDRMHYTQQEWLKTPEEMALIFNDIPEALGNTQGIVDKVEFYDINHEAMMPKFQIPPEFGTMEAYMQTYSEADLMTEFELGDKAGKERMQKLGGIDAFYRIKLESDYLKEQTMIGAKERYGENLSANIIERIDFELKVMRDMGYPGYFLIVQDLIQAARNMGVTVGPGRGSAAGSVVAYCLQITNIDPLRYDLLFERFLNPDRISLPDIDIDFDDEGRGKVLDWVTEKYGKEKVAHIITYGTMAAKSSIKD
ncbi:MAG: PHP domain-containing protein, partial [Bacteroidales bacterium]|nr:PHP domain-containing protein [Bacteroidales bacterium]